MSYAWRFMPELRWLGVLTKRERGLAGVALPLGADQKEMLRGDRPAVSPANASAGPDSGRTDDGD
jgi:hypothetical protein